MANNDYVLRSGGYGFCPMAVLAENVDYLESVVTMTGYTSPISDGIRIGMAAMIATVIPSYPQNVGKIISTQLTINVPAHNAGDLILLLHRSITTNVAPATLPGFTSLAIAEPNFGNGSRASYAIDTLNTINTINNPSGHAIAVHVFTGCSGIGNVQVRDIEDEGVTATFPTLALNVTDGSSRAIVCLANNQGNGATPSIPANMTLLLDGLRPNNFGGGEFSTWMSDSGVTSFSGKTSTWVTPAARWITYSIELLADGGDSGTFRQEIVVVTARTGNDLTLGRGCCDTVPAEHLIGATIWFFDDSLGNDGIEYAGTETIGVKVLPRTSTGGEVPVEYSAPKGLTFNLRFARPYPPGKVEVDGSPWYVVKTINGTTNSSLDITWAHRDRITQQDQLIDHLQGNIGPETGTTYEFRVYKADGTLVRTVVGLTGTFWSYAHEDAVNDFFSGASAPGNYPGYIMLRSMRDTLGSFQEYRIDFILSLAVVVVGCNAKLLLHFEDNFADSSPSAHTPTPLGGAVTSTTRPKWDARSFLSNGAMYVTYPDHADFNFGSRRWSVDFQLYIPASVTLATDNVIVCSWGSGVGAPATNAISWLIEVFSNGHLGILYSVDGSTLNGGPRTASAAPLPRDAWMHVAIWRPSSDGIQSAINGTSRYSVISGAYTMYDSAVALGVLGTAAGGAIAPSGITIDELRICVDGQVEYDNADFTPPAGPYCQGAPPVPPADAILTMVMSMPVAVVDAAIAMNLTQVANPGTSLGSFYQALFYYPTLIPQGGDVILSMTMDGEANASTNFIDGSTHAHPLTAVRNAQITTTAPLEGSGSLLVNHGLTNIDADYVRVGALGSTPTVFRNFFQNDFTIRGKALFNDAAGGTLFSITYQQGDLTFSGVRMGFAPYTTGQLPSFVIQNIGEGVLSFNGATAAPVGVAFDFAFVGSDNGRVSCYVNGFNTASFYFGQGASAPQNFIPFNVAVNQSASPTIGGGGGGVNNGKVDSIVISKFATTNGSPLIPNGLTLSMQFGIGLGQAVTVLQPLTYTTNGPTAKDVAIDALIAQVNSSTVLTSYGLIARNSNYLGSPAMAIEGPVGLKLHSSYGVMTPGLEAPVFASLSNLFAVEFSLGSPVAPDALNQQVTATLSGTPAVGYRFTVRLGGVAFSYISLTGATLSSVATALAAVIDANANYVAAAVGAVITIDGVVPVAFTYSALTEFAHAYVTP